MNWHSRYKAMKSGLGLTNSDISKITGNTSDSIKSVTQPNKEIPRWLKLAIFVYERISLPSKEWLMDVIDEVVDDNQTLCSENIAEAIIDRWPGTQKQRT